MLAASMEEARETTLAVGCALGSLNELLRKSTVASPLLLSRKPIRLTEARLDTADIARAFCAPKDPHDPVLASEPSSAPSRGDDVREQLCLVFFLRQLVQQGAWQLAQTPAVFLSQPTHRPLLLLLLLLPPLLLLPLPVNGEDGARDEIGRARATRPGEEAVVEGDDGGEEEDRGWVAPDERIASEALTSSPECLRS